MEKFSQFRDPGTGIQPFLKPVTPAGSETTAAVAYPFGLILGVVRTLILFILAALYVLLVEGFCLVFKSVPPLHRLVSYVFTAVLARLVLFVIGHVWIPVETVTRKRGRGAKAPEKWAPGAGDIIVSNWASIIEVIWLAFRFDPIFVLPVRPSIELTKSSPMPGSPITRTPGRRTGTGSAAISSPAAREPKPRVPITGFRRISLLSMLHATGHVPELAENSPDVETLEHIRSKADRPVVVFPECTTSNGRGLLRFAELFRGVKLPVSNYKIYVMCVRYDPPTALSQTLSFSIPSSTLNPIPHLFSLTTGLLPYSVSIRLLSPAESPSSGSFLASEFLTLGNNDDVLTEACAALIAQIGKMKRMGLGWEDKVAFLEFYKGRKK